MGEYGWVQGQCRKSTQDKTEVGRYERNPQREDCRLIVAGGNSWGVGENKIIKNNNKKDTLTVYAEKIWAYKTSGLQSDLVSWKKWQGG